MKGEAGKDDPYGCGPLVPPVSEASRPLKLQIFERVRATGLISRIRISKDLGISPASVSTATAELIEAGYLREQTQPRDAADVGRGRPPVTLCVRPEAHMVAGVKLSDREHTGILVDFAGRQIAAISQQVQPGAADPDVQVAALVRLVEDLSAQAGIARHDIAAVGLGLPGFVDHGAGHVFWSPVLTVRNVALSGLAARALDLPVTIDNDANLVALAELWFGVGRQRSDFAVVTIEHGVGTGLILNHRLFRGAHGLGVELGHTKVQLDGALCRCGQRGCLEAYVADYALAREASAAMGLIGQPITPMPALIDRLFREAQAGNEAARSIFGRAARYLAVGLANVVNLFDPALIILSGDRMRYDYLYSDGLLEEVGRFTLNSGKPPPPIEVHAWGDLLWAHGAAALALSTLTEERLGPPREAAA